MKIRNFNAVVVLLFLPLTAGAAPLPKLSQFFRQQFEQLPQALEACSLPDGGADGGPEESRQMTTFFLDVAPYVGFGISSVFEIQVVPEVEFVFTHGAPDEDGG